MGTYVNPKGRTKEDWLNANAIYLGTDDPSFDLVDADTTLICHVNNGPFTAALVVDNRYDYECVVKVKDDPRPRMWFLAEKALVEEVV